jgi:hypothetical protein
MQPFQSKPEPFFDLVIHDKAGRPGLTGASAGYEQGKFRNDELADYLFDWLPEFALKYSELEEFNSVTAMRLVKQAAKVVYTTDKYQKRGEFGELLLHALLRQVFDSEPAISKIYYKSANNETVKGFDAVHIVENGDALELWLGEVKFYKNANTAVADITKEIVDHTEQRYLRDEFVLIGTKLDPRWKHCDKVKELINRRKSLDEVFARICIPALVTYESGCVASHTKVCTEFKDELKAEMAEIAAKFGAAKLPDIRIHLFLVPLHEKETLVKLLHSKLEGMQR